MLQSDGRFTLRVKHGSELHKMLSALQEEPRLQEELQQIGGYRGSPNILRRLNGQFDNMEVAVDKRDVTGPHSLLYTDVTPNRIEIINDNMSVDGTGADQHVGKLIINWPEAPPIPDVLEDFDVPDWYEATKRRILAGKNISFEGPPGVGKDTAVIQMAAELKQPLVTIGGEAGFRKRDLTGSFVDVGRFDAGEYVTAAINGWWVLLTEVNAADADALMFINAQLAPPYIVMLNGRAYPVHKNFRLFVSYNHGLIGTKPLPQSFKDRFRSIKVPFFSTEYQLRKRLVKMGMPEEADVVSARPWQDVIVKYGMAMWSAHERGQMRYQITTRRLIDAVDDMKMFPNMTVEDALRDAVINAIDSPVEAITAKTVLSQIINDGGQ